MALPDLDRLGHADKDELIRALFAQVVVLTAQVESLTSKVAELEGRLAQNSCNASQATVLGRLGKAQAKIAAQGGAESDKRPARPQRPHPETG